MFRRREQTPSEEGFALIGAIWVLVLAGSIVALLLLGSRMRGEAVDVEASVLARQLAERSAVETVVAERLFLGAPSRWWLLPAEGSVQVGEQAIRLQLSDTSTQFNFFDATEADRATFLARLGLSDVAQTGILDAARGKRGRSALAAVNELQRHPIVPAAEVRRLCETTSIVGQPNLADFLSSQKQDQQSQAQVGSLISISAGAEPCGGSHYNRVGSAVIVAD